jgi:hypothetical protein
MTLVMILFLLKPEPIICTGIPCIVAGMRIWAALPVYPVITTPFSSGVSLTL